MSVILLIPWDGSTWYWTCTPRLVRSSWDLIRPEAVDHAAIAKEQNTVMVTAGEMLNAIILFHTGSCLSSSRTICASKVLTGIRLMYLLTQNHCFFHWRSGSASSNSPSAGSIYRSRRCVQVVFSRLLLVSPISRMRARAVPRYPV